VTSRIRLLLRREAGFTLPELLVSMTVVGILLAVAAMAISSAIRHSDEVEDQAVIQAEVRGALEQFSQDVRQAYSGDQAVFPIESISPTQITLLSPDRQVPFHLRRVSYRVNGGQLQRARATSTDTDGAPWVIPSLSAWARLAGPVSTAAPFTYYREDGTQLTTFTNPALVKTVKVRLDVATNSAPGRVFKYETSVSVRADA
jgi:prepilin-type N-terminal cleavage/methylation domain-containing protein